MTGELLALPKMGQRQGQPRPARSQRRPQRIGVGGTGVHFDRPPAQIMLTLLQRRDHELTPRLPVARTLIRQVHVIRTDHIPGREQPELGTQDVPPQPAPHRIPAPPLKQRASEQLRRSARRVPLRPHAPDEDDVAIRADQVPWLRHARPRRHSSRRFGGCPARA